MIDGFAQGDDVQIFIGGVSVALLAIATDLFFTVGERWVLPRTQAKDRIEIEAAPKSGGLPGSSGDLLQRGKRGCQLTWRRHRPIGWCHTERRNPCGAASAMVSLGRPWCWPSWPPPAGRVTAPVKQSTDPPSQSEPRTSASAILAEIYSQALADGGYTTEVQSLAGSATCRWRHSTPARSTSREYAASMLEFLNDFAGEASGDAAETTELLQASR